MIETEEPKTESWLAEFQTSLKNNPRSAAILLALTAVLAFLVVRQFMGGHSPGFAEARPAAAASYAVAPQPQPQADHSTRQSPSGATLADWARQPTDKTSRNLFAVSLDDYPIDPAHAQSASESAKSDSAQADQMKERQILVENLRAQAAKMTLEGVVLGASPKAWVDGLLVGIGQPIGDTGFRVVKIEARRIFVQRDDVQIELAMK
jgi:hypothetical protein